MYVQADKQSTYKQTTDRPPACHQSPDHPRTPAPQSPTVLMVVYGSVLVLVFGF
jgi:hypothetical protein